MKPFSQNYPGFSCVHRYPEGECCPACGELPVISEHPESWDMHEHYADCDGEWPCSCISESTHERGAHEPR